jgi:hypothetical protein
MGCGPGIRLKVVTERDPEREVVPGDEAETYEAEAREADATEYGHGTPVKVEIGPAPMSAFAVSFDADTVEALRERAAAEGVGVTQLVRAWVLERLDSDERLPVAAAEALNTLRDSSAVHGGNP